jgi:hypothetical protein
MTFFPHAVAAALGLLLAHRERRFRFMGRALAALLILSAARIVSRLPRPDIAQRAADAATGLRVPAYEGLARASWAVEQPVVTAWYAVLTWAVWRALKDEAPGAGAPGAEVPSMSGPSTRRPRHQASTSGPFMGPARVVYLALAFLASPVPLFFLYPLVRGRPVEIASVVVFCIALAVQLAAATRYILRWRRPDVAQGVALVLVVGSVADAAGPYLFARPALDWLSGEPVGVLIWLVINGVELWVIATKRGH